MGLDAGGRQSLRTDGEQSAAKKMPAWQSGRRVRRSSVLLLLMHRAHSDEQGNCISAKVVLTGAAPRAAPARQAAWRKQRSVSSICRRRGGTLQVMICPCRASQPRSGMRCSCPMAMSCSARSALSACGARYRLPVARASTPSAAGVCMAHCDEKAVPGVCARQLGDPR